MGKLLRRLNYLLHHRRLAAELEREMAFHREMAGPDAHRNFGNQRRLREAAHEAWGWTWLERLGQDLNYAARTLRRSPGFTATAVLVLAVGIGVNIAAFQLFNLVVLKPLPVRDPASLVRLQRRSPEIINGEMPYPSVLYYGSNARTLAAVIATMGVPPMQIDGDGDHTSTGYVTPNYFSELGIMPAMGRVLDPQRDNSLTTTPVAVLSYGLWQRRFGGDPSVVGRVLHVNATPVVVVGVLPLTAPALGGQSPDLWLSLAQQPLFVEGSKLFTDTGGGTVRMWARLAPGVSAKAAEAELLALTNERRKQTPQDIWKDEYLRSDPAGHLQVWQPEMLQIAEMIAVLTLLILGVACANLGSLLLARSLTRERELGIRVALGASRARVFGQLFTESLLLAVLGALAGLALGTMTTRLVLTTTDAPRWLSAAPDWRVLLFVVGIAGLTCVLFGFAPALQIARQGQRKTLARQILVGAQVAASCVLLIVASLLVRALHHALTTDPGFGYEQIIAVEPGLGQHGYTPSRAAVLLDQAKSRLESLPGVASVSLAKIAPLGHTTVKMDTVVNGRNVAIYPNWIDAQYFQTMGVPLLLGRTFLPGETHAVVVSESLARLQWPGENPLGKRYGDTDLVVGVAGNARVNSLNEDDTVELYQHAGVGDMPDMVLVLNTRGSPEGLTEEAKAAVGNLDPKLFPEIRLLKSAFRRDMHSLETAVLVVSLIGMLALLLASVGMIGLVAFSVSQRLKEIAIRMALGAKRLQVLTAVLEQFVWPVAGGLLAGMAFAAATSRVLRRVLYGVSNLDAFSYAAAILFLLAAIALAALLPMRKAMHLDLSRMLHVE